ncbi:MAG: hypothetical protein AB7E52_04655 [Bdellovibrionales bacterium]
MRKLCMLLLLCLLGIGGFSSSAHAFTPIQTTLETASNLIDGIQKEVYWAMKEVKNAKIIKQLSDLLNSLDSIFDDLYDLFGLNSSLEATSDIITTKLEVALTKERVDAYFAAMRAAEESRVVGKYTLTNTAQVCRSIMVHQLTATTLDFAREVSRMLVEGISARGRSAGTTGPIEVYKNLMARCGGKIKFGSAIDGTTACTDSTTAATVGTDGRRLQESDMMGPDPSQIYEMPQIESAQYTDEGTGQKVIVRYPADPTTAEQKFWLAKFYWLYNIAGNRPIPLPLDSPVGVTQRRMFYHCAANQNGLIKQCADWIAFLTRPNSTDPSLQPLRDYQKSLCEKAKNNVDLSRYDGCEKGLSAYEAYKIEQSWCKASNHYVSLKGTGATNNETDGAIEDCSRLSTNLSDLIFTLKDNCDAAIRAMDDLNGCWATVDALGETR